MKTMILAAMLITSTTYAAAQKNPNWYFQKVTGAEALQDHSINQYDDSNHPPQAYDITLPAGYSLTASDVESGGNTVCSVTRFDYKTQRLTIEALAIETDAGGCTVTLTVFNSANKTEAKVQYSIEQTGT